MTLLLVWTNKPDDATAINIASDSLLSTSTDTWEYAAKIHRLYPTRTYLAYCGSSFGALSAITSATAAIACSDNLRQVEGDGAPTIQARVGAIQLHLKDTFDIIPAAWGRDATLLIADYDQRKEKFSAYTIEMSGQGVGEPVELDLTSKRVHCFGSGAAEARSKLTQLQGAGELSTKTIVRTLIEVIDGTNRSVGGAPQMVMLTKAEDRPVGFWWRGGAADRRLFGLPIKFSSKMERVHWVTEDFEPKPFSVFRRSVAGE